MKEMDLFGNQYYYLMNKDIKLAKFTIEGTGEMEYINVVKSYWNKPFYIQKDIGLFIANRRSPKHRENIDKLLELSGCDTISGYLNVTHALSLIDTYWVKPVNSKLYWNDISLYTHEFNDLIARTAFEGGLHGNNFSTTSPEYGTDGTFAKCWIREHGQIKLLKRGSSGARNAGLEPYSEYYASQIIKELSGNYVGYGIRYHHNRLCSECNIFTSENTGYVPFSAIKDGEYLPIHVIKKMEKFNLAEEVKDMFVIDSVILNEDRHMGNFGLLVNNDNYSVEGMAPLFDHNISLLPYAELEQFEDIENYLSEKGPRIGRYFINVAKDCLTPKMKKKLNNLYGFKFDRSGDINLPDWRLDYLEQIVNKQIKDILS